MKSLVLVKPGQTEVREITKPIPVQGEVLLRVSKVGICGGDLNGYRGTFALQEYPNILGHEIGAVIEEVGPGVPSRWQSGMKVTVSPYQNCTKCVSCFKGRPNACVDNRTLGVRRPGAMTDYVAVPFEKLYSSETLSLTALALVEPLTVGFHAVHRGEVQHNDTVLVIGCGIVGMGVLACAVQRGAKVIAADIDDIKLSIATKAGAWNSVNTKKQDLHEAVKMLTDNCGVDVVIEAVGLPQTYLAAVEIAAYTGRVVYIGYAKAPVSYETRLFVQKELTIRGSRNCVSQTDFPAVIKFLETGAFPINDVITKTVGLTDAGNAISEWDKNPGAFMKIMVDIDGQKL